MTEVWKVKKCFDRAVDDDNFFSIESDNMTVDYDRANDVVEVDLKMDLDKSRKDLLINIMKVNLVEKLVKRKIEDDTICCGKHSQPPEAEANAKVDAECEVDNSLNVLPVYPEVEPKISFKPPQKRSFLIWMFFLLVSWFKGMRSWLNPSFLADLSNI